MFPHLLVIQKDLSTTDFDLMFDYNADHIFVHNYEFINYCEYMMRHVQKAFSASKKQKILVFLGDRGVGRSIIAQ